MSTPDPSLTPDAPNAPDAAALLKKVAWGGVSKRLTAYASRCLGAYGRLADAEEIAQEAIAQLYDPRYRRWDPVQQPDVFVFLAGLVKGLVSNRRRVKGTTHERNTTHERLARFSAPKGDTPEGLLARAEHGAKVAAGIRARLDGDALAREVLALTEEGVGTLAEQIELTGRPHAEVRNARRRLAVHADAVTADLDGGDDARS